MRRLSPGHLALGLLAGLALPWMSPMARAADGERVKFDSVDGVELHGTFYPSRLGSKAACVLMLHALGGSCEQEGWADLAKKLQEKDLAVLMFDFRGHGESTTVAPTFWQVPANQTLKSFRSTKFREQISYKDFTTSHNWASLVDDIGAAKHFLDRKNDSGECNSSNVALLGAEGGATLGTLWLWDAWKRRRVVPAFGLAGAAGQNQAEGQDVACAVWLSITPALGVTMKYNAPVENWLRTPVREKVPMYFLYGEQDTRAANYAKRLCDNVLHPDSGATKLKNTGKNAIKDTKLQGRELLGKPSLNTEDLILRYITLVMERKSPYVKRDAERVFQVRIPVEAYLR
jgi:pimeloyl-ACP methyl ester carboxylesterase